MQISIIIPVYNVSEYLQACVDSVLSNDCQDCEILLVDDGSTDGVCPALCDRIGMAHPDLIRVIHQENRGLGGARNTGIDAAKGEYLFFVDSDDTIEPETLAVLKEKVKDTQADIVAFDFCSVLPNGKKTKVFSSVRLPESSFTLRQCPDLLRFTPSACTKLWRRTLFIKSGVRFPERVWYEDIRTSSKLYALADGIVYIPKALYRYLLRTDSIMNNRSLERNHEIVDAFEDILSWYEAEGLLEQYRQVLCALTVEHVLMTASVRVARIDPKHHLLKVFSDFTSSRFPDYKRTFDRSLLPRTKRLALMLVEAGQYRLLNILFRLKG